MTLFEGADVALTTPFKENGEVNYEKLEEIVGERIAGGMNAIIACGTAGGAFTMTHKEHLDVIEYIYRVTKKRIPVITGIGPSCTETAVYLPTEAEKRGADRLLLVSPYYNKTIQKGLMAHFMVVADAVKIPIVLYGIPGRTGVTIKPEIIAALYKDVDNIVGVKKVSSNFSAIVTFMSLLDGKVDLYLGDGGRTVPFLSLGGKGVISVLSNVTPRQTHDTCASYFVEDVKTSASLQLKAIPLIMGLFSGTNPVPVKAAVSMMGKGMGSLHMPLAEMEPQSQEKLKKAMADYSILQGRFRERAVCQW